MAAGDIQYHRPPPPPNPHPVPPQLATDTTFTCIASVYSHIERTSLLYFRILWSEWRLAGGAVVVFCPVPCCELSHAVSCPMLWAVSRPGPAPGHKAARCVVLVTGRSDCSHSTQPADTLTYLQVGSASSELYTVSASLIRDCTASTVVGLV